MAGDKNSQASLPLDIHGSEASVNDRESDYGPSSKVALALKEKGYTMPQLHDLGKKQKNEKDKRPKKGEKNKQIQNTPIKKENDEAFAPAKALKQLTMTDFKYLSKAKIPKDPAEEMANMKDLYEKDPSDKTRECTIQEAMMMIMNICEENHIKKEH